MMLARIQLFDIRTAAVALPASATMVKGDAGHARNQRLVAGICRFLTPARTNMTRYPVTISVILAKVFVNSLSSRSCECGGLRG